MSAPLIDVKFLEETWAEHGRAVKFRLPNMPELPRRYRGAVLTAWGLLQLFKEAVGNLSMASLDETAAPHEDHMARQRTLGTVQRQAHMRRAAMFRRQKRDRQLLAYAKIIAISDAVFV